MTAWQSLWETSCRPLAGTAANGGAPVRVSVFVVASLALKVAAAQVVAVCVVVVVSSTILLVGEDSRR